MPSTLQRREAVLSLGSNQGDRAGWLSQAREALDTWPGIRITRVSPIYETAPVGIPSPFAQEQFLNQIVITETSLVASAFSHAIHDIESRLGRTRTPDQAYGAPRSVDIDIITFGNLRLETPELTLPHPRAHLRRFVLQPLVDLLPDFTLPGDTRTVTELLASLPPTPGVSRLVGDPPPD